MEFVAGLPDDAGDTMEIAFDDIGRAEFFRGRLRVTLVRRVIGGEGKVQNLPAINLVCSAESWLMARKRGNAIFQMIEEALLRPQRSEDPAPGVSQTH